MASNDMASSESSFVFSVFTDIVSLEATPVTIGILVITLILTICYVRKAKKRPVQSPTMGPVKPRFRKREMVKFYGRKMLRKVKDTSVVKSFTKGAKAEGGRRGNAFRRRDFVRLARSLSGRLLLRGRSENTRDTWRMRGPPSSLLEAPYQTESGLVPSELAALLKSVRVFGHFETPVVLDLCRHIVVKDIDPGSVLFNIGDDDDAIYVVQKGHIKLYINESEGQTVAVKDVKAGDSIHSVLSVLDCLTGHMAPYKTVTARAVEYSTVLKLPIDAFNSVLNRYPESLVRIVQVIMVRLQRVTFLALHNYLGLSSQLHSSAQASGAARSGLPAQDSPREHRTEDAPRFSSVYRTRQQDSQTDADSQARPPTDLDFALERARIKEEGDMFTSGSPETRSSGWRRLQEAPSTMESNPRNKLLLEHAHKRFAEILGLEDKSKLEGRVTLRQAPSGHTLCAEGDSDASLMLVLSGTLQIQQSNPETPEQQAIPLFTASKGDLIGTLAVLTGEPSFYSVITLKEVRMALISKEHFYELMRHQPTIVLNTAHTVLKRVSPFVRQIDFALDWMQLDSGRALYSQTDKSESMFIVLNGRLRSVMETGEKKELMGEYGRGDLVGIVEVVTNTPRATTLSAVRDTELAVIPNELLKLIQRRYPQVVGRIISLLGNKVLGGYQRKSMKARGVADAHGVELRQMLTNMNTVALMAVGSEVPLHNFTLELQHALNGIGSTLRLTSDIITNRLGSTALDRVNEYRLCNWLAQQEDIHKCVLYQCDNKNSAWTQRCLRQADCVLIVGLASVGPKVGKLEQEILHQELRAQKELVILHKEDATTPTGTAAWLQARDWISAHHHVRCPKRVLSRKGTHKIREIYERQFATEPDKMSDFSRLARLLTGTSIGLALGGGGARGISHIGVIRAMHEWGIPIDVIGGTSIGSFVGALWAEELDVVSATQRGRDFSMEFGKMWKKLFDLTYPITSMFTGASFNNAIKETFGERQIEDLWIPYFCITTDISNSKMKIHTSGSVWRYVRASMSLAGYLPPLCDPDDGHLLLDGGYVNNLPADVMAQQGCHTVFAVDVGSQDDTSLTNYGEQLSGWWLLWKRWNPWSERVRVPDMGEIQSRLAYISCTRLLEVVKTSDFCRYIRPPIDRFQTLQFTAFDEILDVGYNHAKAWLEGMDKERLQREVFVQNPNPMPLISASKGGSVKTSLAMAQQMSFTDLATVVNLSQFSHDAEYGLSRYDSDITEAEDEFDEEEDEEERGGSEPEAFLELAASAPTVILGSASADDEESLRPESLRHRNTTEH